jgi:hypothetical protein
VTLFHVTYFFLLTVISDRKKCYTAEKSFLKTENNVDDVRLTTQSFELTPMGCNGFGTPGPSIQTRIYPNFGSIWDFAKFRRG